MTEAKATPQDRRTRRTQSAVFDALRRLLFERRYDKIRTSDLIDAAGVGRSTFYEHFRNKDDVLVAMIDPVFLPLARAAAGSGTREALTETLNHIWAQRAAARPLLEPPLVDRLQRKLALLIEVRIRASPGGPPASIIATGAACGCLGVLRMWVTGEVSCPAPVLAGWLADGAAAPNAKARRQERGAEADASASVGRSIVLPEGR